MEKFVCVALQIFFTYKFCEVSIHPFVIGVHGFCQRERKSIPSFFCNCTGYEWANWWKNCWVLSAFEIPFIFFSFFLCAARIIFSWFVWKARLRMKNTHSPVYCYHLSGLGIRELFLCRSNVFRFPTRCIMMMGWNLLFFFFFEGIWMAKNIIDTKFQHLKLFPFKSIDIDSN